MSLAEESVVPLLVRQAASYVVLGALGVLAIVASAAALGWLLPEDSHTADALMIAVSIIGAGILFGSPAVSIPVRWSDRSARWVLGAKFVGTAAMFSPGFAVVHLFGPDDSGWTLLRVAIALWLPAIVLLNIGVLIGATDEADEQESGVR